MYVCMYSITLYEFLMALNQAHQIMPLVIKVLWADADADTHTHTKHKHTHAQNTHLPDKRTFKKLQL